MKNVHFQNRLRQTFCPLSILTASIFGAAAAHGSVSLSISDGIGNPNAISIASGSTFNITLQLISTSETSLGVGYFLSARGSGSGKFSIVSRDAGGTLFNDFTTSSVSGVVLNDPNAGGSPAPTSTDLGALLLDVPSVPSGSYFLANFSVSTNNLAPGTYVIDANTNSTVVVPDSNATDGSGIGSIPVSSNLYTITVVPEPGSAALLLGGLGCLGMIRRRKR